MIGMIICLVMGLLIVVLGIINMTGNISTLHSYHRKRVTEENRKPFGRLVGIGTSTIGISLMIAGPLLYAHEKTSFPVFLIIGSVVLALGFLVGLSISFYAMIKYNHGIF